MIKYNIQWRDMYKRNTRLNSFESHVNNNKDNNNNNNEIRN